MSDKRNLILPHPVKVKIKTISAGETGSLSVIESSRDLPFIIKRIYYIYGMKEKTQRGFHAHKSLCQCLIAMNGNLELKLTGPAGDFSFKLTRPDEGVIIPPGYWREMHGLGPETVVAVLASEDYNEEDYIRNYHDFEKWLAALNIVNRVPYLDLTRSNPVMKKEMEEATDKVIQSGCFINGPRVKEFEQKFADFCGAGYAVGTGNGLDALTLILQALEIGSGDEVVVCAAGFVATALAVSRAGASLVFADCLPGGNLDPEALEKAITPQTKAIIPTHLYGIPANMDAINQLASKYGLQVIEDACQAHGARYRGRSCGALGRAAAFSFYPTKNLGALGDGGCVVTSDAELAEKVRRLANYGSIRKYYHEVEGTNSRLDELQAALLLVKLPYLEEWNSSRRALWATYEETLKNITSLALPLAPEGCRPVCHVYAVRVKNGRRDELASFLAEKNIGTNIHYPQPLHKQACYAEKFGQLSFPEAEAWANETLSLPLDAFHTQAEIDYVCRMVKEFFFR